MLSILRYCDFTKVTNGHRHNGDLKLTVTLIRSIITLKWQKPFWLYCEVTVANFGVFFKLVTNWIYRIYHERNMTRLLRHVKTMTTIRTAFGSWCIYILVICFISVLQGKSHMYIGIKCHYFEANLRKFMFKENILRFYKLN